MSHANLFRAWVLPLLVCLYEETEVAKIHLRLKTQDNLANAPLHNMLWRLPCITKLESNGTAAKNLLQALSRPWKAASTN